MIHFVLFYDVFRELQVELKKLSAKDILFSVQQKNSLNVTTKKWNQLKNLALRSQASLALAQQQKTIRPLMKLLTRKRSSLNLSIV